MLAIASLLMVSTVKVTSLLIVALGFNFESRALPEMKIWCVEGM